MVDGEIGLHGPELVVLEGRPHALRLLTGAVLGVPVHGLAVVFVAAQRCVRGEKGWLDPITDHHHFDMFPSALLIGCLH